MTKKINLMILFVSSLALVLFYFGCSGIISSTSTEKSNSHTVEPGEVELFLPRFIESADVAGANTEASEILSAVNAYFADRGTFLSTSDSLTPRYFSKSSRAKYYFNANGSISKVESVSGGWVNIVFSLSQQKWVTGSPDNNHPNDLDIP